MPIQDRLYIGGEWVASTGADVIDVVSPVSEEVVARAAAATISDMDAAAQAASNSFRNGEWRQTAPEMRADVLDRVAAEIESRSDEIAEVITLQMGAPIGEIRGGQIPVAAALLRYYAQLARTFPFEERRTNGHATSLVAYEPVGVVAAIVAWNAPLLLAVLKVAPALAAGCSVILKPAPETPLDAGLLADCFAQAGLPRGALSVVPSGASSAEHLVRHPLVDKVSFTGSTAVGKRIAALCADDLRRVSLELGGKSAAIVLDDAPLDKTIARLVPLCIENNGQSCVAQTRVLVPQSRYAEFVDAMTEKIASLVVGDPLDPGTNLGPLVSERQRDRVEGYITLGREEGASVVLGGGRPKELDHGWYVEPTIFTGVDNSMRIAQEEIFGPVVVVIPYHDDQEAIAIANDSRYGLAGSVWTGEVTRGLDVARQVRTGSFRVNGAGHILETPAGGFKQSGLQREFGPEGLVQFTEQKAIAVRLPE